MSGNQITLMADEIRSSMGLNRITTAQYSGSDLDAFKHWSSAIAFYTSGAKLEIPSNIAQPEKCMQFLTRCHSMREEFYTAHCAVTDAKIDTFKKKVVEFMATDEGLKACRDATSAESSLFLENVGSFSSIRALITSYYKLKVSSDGGTDFFRLIGEDFLKATISIIEEKPLDTTLFNYTRMKNEAFKDDFESVKKTITNFSQMFLKSGRETRKILIEHFKDMMKSILACMVLCRFPVIIINGYPPVYFGHFIASIKFAPYLDFFGISLASLCITPF